MLWSRVAYRLKKILQNLNMNFNDGSEKACIHDYESYFDLILIFKHD